MNRSELEERLARLPACQIDGCVSGRYFRLRLGLCPTHYEEHRARVRARQRHTIRRPRCPECGSGNTVVYHAEDGDVLEWRCMDPAHEPSTFLGRNFVIT